MDKTNPFGNGNMLPRGILREPARHIKRADIIFLTKCRGDTSQVKNEIRRWNTKADIVEAVYNDKALNFNRAEVKNIVENLLVLMKQAIKKDDTLLISGFGKFEAYDKNARKGRNPQTDESITLPPRKVVVFRLSRKFRVELNGGEEE